MDGNIGYATIHRVFFYAKDILMNMVRDTVMVGSNGVCAFCMSFLFLLQSSGAYICAA